MEPFLLYIRTHGPTNRRGPLFDPPHRHRNTRDRGVVGDAADARPDCAAAGRHARQHERWHDAAAQRLAHSAGRQAAQGRRHAAEPDADAGRQVPRRHHQRSPAPRLLDRRSRDVDGEEHDGARQRVVRHRVASGRRRVSTPPARHRTTFRSSASPTASSRGSGRSRCRRSPARASPAASPSTNGKTLYVTRVFAQTLSSIDLASGQVVKTVSLRPSPTPAWSLPTASRFTCRCGAAPASRSTGPIADAASKSS